MPTHLDEVKRYRQISDGTVEFCVWCSLLPSQLLRAAASPRQNRYSALLWSLPVRSRLVPVSSKSSNATKTSPAKLADLYVTGDTFTARLVFKGHFTGIYNGIQGRGQTINCNAIDIQHLDAGARITEDWHLEDNLAFLQQAGLVTIAGSENPNRDDDIATADPIFGS